jgi:hypothetical protein
MVVQSLATATLIETGFPAAEVRRRLLGEVQRIADEASILRPEWEPLLDSQRIVGTVLALEDLFPFRLPPDKVVRKGGYDSVEEAVDDMLVRIKRIWAERYQKGVPK